MFYFYFLFGTRRTKWLWSQVLLRNHHIVGVGLNRVCTENRRKEDFTKMKCRNKRNNILFEIMFNYNKFDF